MTFLLILFNSQGQCKAGLGARFFPVTNKNENDIYVKTDNILSIFDTVQWEANESYQNHQKIYYMWSSVTIINKVIGSIENFINVNYNSMVFPPLSNLRLTFLGCFIWRRSIIVEYNKSVRNQWLVSCINPFSLHWLSISLSMFFHSNDKNRRCK